VAEFVLHPRKNRETFTISREGRRRNATERSAAVVETAHPSQLKFSRRGVDRSPSAW